MISDVFVRILAEASVRTALVLALTFAVAWTLRRGPAELRHAMWKASLLAALLIPLGLLLMPRWKLPILPAAEALSIEAATVTTVSTAEPINGWIEPLPLPRSRFPWSTAIALVWLAGCSLMLLREVRCRRRLARLLREAPPVADPRLSTALREAAERVGLDAAFECRVSSELSVPLACGVARPTVLLPERAGEWSAAILSDVLVHELSHLRRRDPLWLWVGRLGRALYWFHPLVWLASRRMLAESERACDDAVMRGGERPSGYAETLLLVATRSGREEPSPALAFVRPHGLERRIAEVLARGRNMRPLGARGRSLLGALALTIGGAAAVAHPVSTCAGTRAEAAPTPAPEHETSWRPGGASRVSKAAVCNENKGPVSLTSVTVQVTPGADEDEAQITQPQVVLENRDRARAVTAVQLGFELPTSRDRMWEKVALAPGRSGEIRLSKHDWSLVVPAADAHRLVVQVMGVRFANGESWAGKNMVTFPASAEKRSKRALAPRAREVEESEEEEAREAHLQLTQDFPDVPSLPARFRNPPGAEVVILEARTPLSKRATGEGQHAALLPAVRLENRTGREVVAVRLRFKAEPNSHAVSGYEVEIPPHSSIVLRRDEYEVWGEPAAMTVQLLGARFADGSVWGTMDSQINSRDPWVYPLEGKENH